MTDSRPENPDRPDKRDYTEEAASVHRWCGVQLNNDTWNVLDNPTIGPDSPIEDREQLLYGAIASTYHWLQVGTVANHARGEHLISRVASLVGMGGPAVHHAERCVELCQANPDDVTDWDLGFAYEALARAQACAGDTETAAITRAKAQELTAAVADEASRSVVQAELDRAPWFGLV